MVNNDKPQLVERRGVYTNLNRLIFVLIGLLIFVIVYPVAEWNISCVHTQTSVVWEIGTIVSVSSTGISQEFRDCHYIKDVLWQVVFLLSAFHGDGLPLTDSVDEKMGRSIIPLTVAIIGVGIVAKRKKND